jgi:hypothetical protein
MIEKDASGEEHMEALEEATIARQAQLVIQLLSLIKDQVLLFWQATC